jgi:hypothetical protein
LFNKEIKEMVLFVCGYVDDEEGGFKYAGRVASIRAWHDVAG